jgi:hypothetical protein
MIVAPIKRAILEVDSTSTRIPYVRAQFRSDYGQFVEQVFAFGREGRFHFDAECNAVKKIVWQFENLLEVLESGRRRGEEIHRFEDLLMVSQDAIRAIPADDPDVILPAASPFETYNRIRAVCASARRRVDLFDPYLDGDAYHRYLTAIDRGIAVNVITSRKIMQPPNDARRDRIVAISTIFAGERSDSYRLLISLQQHDRHMRVDDEILHLGGSVKDASLTAPYTLGRLDPTQSNHAFLDSIIASSEEWYGPKTPMHRRV